MRVRLGPAEERLFRKLDPSRRDAYRAALKKFQSNPRLPGLRFKRLAGGGHLYSIRVSNSERIILRALEDADTFAIVDMGPHDIYRDL